jgi:hypothetical protein
LQKLVTDEMRGRVMSMFMLSFIGAMPIGNLIAGAASHRFGAPHTLAAGGVVITIFVVLVTWRTPAATVSALLSGARFMQHSLS